MEPPSLIRVYCYTNQFIDWVNAHFFHVVTHLRPYSLSEVITAKIIKMFDHQCKLGLSSQCFSFHIKSNMDLKSLWMIMFLTRTDFKNPQGSIFLLFFLLLQKVNFFYFVEGWKNAGLNIYVIPFLYSFFSGEICCLVKLFLQLLSPSDVTQWRYIAAILYCVVTQWHCTPSCYIVLWRHTMALYSKLLYCTVTSHNSAILQAAILSCHTMVLYSKLLYCTVMSHNGAIL